MSSHTEPEEVRLEPELHVACCTTGTCKENDLSEPPRESEIAGLPSSASLTAQVRNKTHARTRHENSCHLFRKHYMPPIDLSTAVQNWPLKNPKGHTRMAARMAVNMSKTPVGSPPKHGHDSILPNSNSEGPGSVLQMVLP